MQDLRKRTSRLAAIALVAILGAGCDEDRTTLGPEGDGGNDGTALSVLRNRTVAQVDRFGLPGVNTAFTDASVLKDNYNQGMPATDEAQFLAALSGVIQARFGLTQAGADGLADFVLPDVQPLGDLSGFPNGRTLDDDVIDTVLSLIFGVFGPSVPALASDNVDGNDMPFLSTFPYLADPHTS